MQTALSSLPSLGQRLGVNQRSRLSSRFARRAAILPVRAHSLSSSSVSAARSSASAPVHLLGGGLLSAARNSLRRDVAVKATSKETTECECTDSSSLRVLLVAPRSGRQTKVVEYFDGLLKAFEGSDAIEASIYTPDLVRFRMAVAG